MKESTGQFFRVKNTGRIYIPIALVLDSSFPFTNKEKIKIKIEEGKLLLDKVTPK